MANLTLVLGGARSGKSRYGEDLVGASGAATQTYIATAEAGDAEMAARIAKHRARRGNDWRTVEAPIELARAITRHGSENAAILVDCLSLWLSNLMAAKRDSDDATAKLLAACRETSGSIVCVANEVGLGIVPDNELARAYRDAAGRMNQAVAAAAGHVVFMAAGLAVVLKPGA